MKLVVFNSSKIQKRILILRIVVILSKKTNLILFSLLIKQRITDFLVYLKTIFCAD